MKKREKKNSENEDAMENSFRFSMEFALSIGEDDDALRLPNARCALCANIPHISGAQCNQYYVCYPWLTGQLSQFWTRIYGLM